jgi:hypothetical protein
MELIDFAEVVAAVTLITMFVAIADIVYKHKTARKILITAIEETQRYKKNVKVQINRNYELLEDLITSNSKNYIVTNDGVEFTLENSSRSYFLENGYEDNSVPKLIAINA